MPWPFERTDKMRSDQIKSQQQHPTTAPHPVTSLLSKSLFSVGLPLLRPCCVVREARVEVDAHDVLERLPGERQGVLPLPGGRRGVRLGLGFRLALDL